MPRLALIYYKLGGGHEAAAAAIAAAVARDHPGWEVETCDVLQLVAPLDRIAAITGFSGETIYNRLISDLGLVSLYKLLLGVAEWNIRTNDARGRKLFATYFAQTKPDVVLSVVPLFNRPLRGALQRVQPGARFATLVTDYANWRRDFWFADSEQDYLVWTAHAARQASEHGVSERRIHTLSGLPIHPRFYAAPPVSVAGERRRLGLDPDRCTALVFFGGGGSPQMVPAIKTLATRSDRFQAIALCGNNTSVRAQIDRLGTRLNCVTVGYTREVPFYMSVADFMVGKPGPGCVNEALHSGLPVLLSSHAMPMERYGLQWVEEKHLGWVWKNTRDLRRLFDLLLEDGVLPQAQERVRQLDNRGVFEAARFICESNWA